MSRYDICIPDPPQECPRCDGVLTGWETRNEGSFWFVWQQGIAAPIDQRLDADLAVPPERRQALRLPSEFTVFGSECSRCGYKFFGEARCTTDGSGIWRTMQLVPPPLVGALIAPGWLQCPECCDAFELRPPKHLYICPSCQRLLCDATKEIRNA